MSFRICCPQCGTCCTVADGDVGRTALCGNCDEPIIISKTPVSISAATSTRTSAPAEFHQPAVAEPELDPTSARALTRPVPRSSSRVWRWGCLGVIATAVFLMLVAAFLPTVVTPRVVARRSECKNNMKQIGLALHNYHDTYRSFPPPYVADEDGRPMHSWRVLILPFMGYQDLYDQYNFDEPWDGPNNRMLWAHIPDEYVCPTVNYAEFMTPYQVVVGENTVFEPGKAISLGDIYDGSSNTVLVVEAASRLVHWTEPRDIVYDPDGPPPALLYSSNHEDSGPHVLYADGSTDFLDEEISYAELRSLIERSDGVYHVR